MHFRRAPYRAQPGQVISPSIFQRWGYNVKVITAFEPLQPRADIVFVPNRQRVPNRRSIPGLTEIVMRKFLFPSDEAVLWSANAIRAAAHLIRRHPRTVVFSTFPPINSHVVAWCLKAKYDVRWIADFRDPLAGSPGRAIANSQTGLGAIPTAVDRVLQSAIFKTADVIIANTDAVRDRWRKQFPGYAAKLVNIWNGFDAEEMAAPARVPARTCKVMAHTGIIYAGRHPGPLLESLERLIRSGRIEPGKLRIDCVGHICWESTPKRGIIRATGKARVCSRNRGVIANGSAQAMTRSGLPAPSGRDCPGSRAADSIKGL